jgi:hypothetical protein
VTLTSDAVPKYIVINSSDVWETTNVYIGYYVYQPKDDYYSETSTGSKDGLPVDSCKPPN